MGFLLFLPAYRHSPGGIIVLMLKNKRNRFLSVEVSVFHTAVQNDSTEKAQPKKMFVPGVWHSTTLKSTVALVKIEA